MIERFRIMMDTEAIDVVTFEFKEGTRMSYELSASLLVIK